MNQVITTGIVLSRTNYQEADRIITFLTPDQGKVKVVAKGVRKNRSKMAAGAELLSISEIGFFRGKGDLGTLTTARMQTYFGNIVQNMDRTMYSYELLKRLNRLTEDNVESTFFKLLSEALAGLNQPLWAFDVVQLWTAMQMLCISGNQPELAYDNHREPLGSAERYSFDFDAMAFYEHPEGMFEVGHVKLLRLCQSQSLTRLAHVRGIEPFVPTSLRLIQTLSQTYLHV